MRSVNPATGALIRTYQDTSEEEAAGILEQADRAQAVWRRTGIVQRGAVIKAAGALLRRDIRSYAVLMAQEMGKPVAQGRSEVEKCAWVCDYFAEHAEQFLDPERITTDAAKSLVVYEPLGVVLGIMPWNFPFWQVIRAGIPALMAGNALVIKHASNVSGCALAIEALVREAGVPEGLFRVVLAGSDRVPGLIAHPRVKAVTFTGSTPAGRMVASQAGAAMKKAVMELGGSDPYLILEDADLDAAAEACVTSRLLNAGQSCVSSKRWIVVEAVRKRFEGLVEERMRAQRMGDPLDEAMTLGPLARQDLRDQLHEQVQRSIEQGARLLLGGGIPDGPGWYYPPTVLTGVVRGMPAYGEELFGPVASIMAVRHEAEAIQVANDSPFGLGAAVFTSDLRRGERIATEQLEAGSCFVNTYVRSDPRLPFGGVKQSGYGRDLSVFGIREFVNIKTVYIR